MTDTKVAEAERRVAEARRAFVLAAFEYHDVNEGRGDSDLSHDEAEAAEEAAWAKLDAAIRAHVMARLIAQGEPLTMTAHHENALRIRLDEQINFLAREWMGQAGEWRTELDAQRAQSAALREQVAAVTAERPGEGHYERMWRDEQEAGKAVRAERDAAVERAERAEAALAESDALMAESVEAMRQLGAKAQCVYCGRVSLESEESIPDHVAVCPKRPEAKLLLALAALEARHERLVETAVRACMEVRPLVAGVPVGGTQKLYADAVRAALSASPSAPPSTVTEKEPSDG